MALSQKIDQDFREALKAKEEVRTLCLRTLKTEVKNKQIEKGYELTDEEMSGVISSLVKKSKQAAEEFRNGGREDLARKEEQEIEILSRYLPKQLTTEEIENILREIIAEVSASSPKDLGKVMKVAMRRMAGKAQGKEVNEIARKLLA